MDRIHRLWNLEGTIVPIDIGLGFYIIRFETKSDYNRVYTGGPWIIQDHYLTVRKWHSNFKADMAEAIKTAVWVRVPLLPMEFYEEDNINEIAEKLGKPLKVDNKTMVSVRGSYARICVEMDLSQPLPPSIAVEKYDYYLEYEHLHLICFSCGRVGHQRETCGALPATEMTGGVAELTVDNHTRADNKPVRFNGQVAQEEPKEIGFGEWMVVSRQPRKLNSPNGPRNPEAQAHNRPNARNTKPLDQPQKQYKGKGPAQQPATSKPNKPNPIGKFSSGSRFSPLAGQASTSSPIPISDQPTPVLIPILKKVTTTAKPKQPNPNLTVDVPFTTLSPTPIPTTKPLPAITTVTYHEFARNAEAAAQGRQEESGIQGRDRSSSPHRDRMVGGRNKPKDKDKRGYRRRSVSVPRDAQSLVETTSIPHEDS